MAPLGINQVAHALVRAASPLLGTHGRAALPFLLVPTLFAASLPASPASLVVVYESGAEVYAEALEGVTACPQPRYLPPGGPAGRHLRA